jgi:uncharacterized protein (DUF608 family)
MSNLEWPVLKRYDSAHLNQIALPLGGIGTGTISLGGRGNLRDWEIRHLPAKGFLPDPLFFALWSRPQGGQASTVLLEGPVPLHEYQGAYGAATPNHGLPRFSHAEFEAAYPFGQVHLEHPRSPVDATIQAFNPFIPGDADSSGIPIAVLRFVISNKIAQPVEVSVCGSLRNFIGSDNPTTSARLNKNEFKTSDSLSGISMTTEGIESDSVEIGTVALSTDGTDVTYRTDWANYSWGDSLLDFWDDFSDDGRLENRETASGNPPTASLASFKTIPAYGRAEFTFYITWHFPNRETWTHDIQYGFDTAGMDMPTKLPDGSPKWVGNYYATKYDDAWDVAVRTAGDLANLERETLLFTSAFCSSDLPEEVKEAALFNLSTLRTQTCFRAADGLFFAWEGCGPRWGSCHGSCTHVWNYESALSSLFGQLSRSMRSVEFGHATDDNGLMSFRVNLPLYRAQEYGVAAADGQMGALMRFYRDWKLCGDDDFLVRYWPKVKKALEFCWIAGGWDADRDGVMEGCQHNTMDVEYYGPNPQMGFWYLGALKAVSAMAQHMGESDFASECDRLFDSGSQWLDSNLFNGDYYEHEIRPPGTALIAHGLRHTAGAKDLTDPELQLGSGCLVDQLVGQYTSHLCGFGHLASNDNIKTTLQSIMRYNFKRGLSDHFNHMRTFALGDESALLMASYPKGRRPKRPFPYYNEVMTGFEYTAAVGMLQEGLTEEGLEVIRAIRERYDGLRRNPFDEAECGHHYARAMASWSAVIALTGFDYDGRSGVLSFAKSERNVVWFWSNGAAWGTVEQVHAQDVVHIGVKVLHGSLKLSEVRIGNGVANIGPETYVVSAGDVLSLNIPVI